MNVTATLNGESVTIVDVNVNGLNIVITYVDADDNLKVYQTIVSKAAMSTIIATGATVVGA
jgi:hypothetical protein